MLGGFANSILGSLIPGLENSHPALAPVLQMLMNQPGGIGGLAAKFQQGGLGDIAQSWIGSGENAPVSSDQVQSVLGSGEGGGLVGQLASRLGVSSEEASGHLAQILPGLVNHLTPTGSVPEENDLQSMAAGLLKQFSA